MSKRTDTIDRNSLSLICLSRALELCNDTRTPKIFPIQVCTKSSTSLSASPRAPILRDNDDDVVAAVIRHPDARGSSKYDSRYLRL